MTTSPIHHTAAPRPGVDSAVQGVLAQLAGEPGALLGDGGLERRLAEAARFGFRRALVPRSTPELAVDLELVRVPTLGAAVALLGLAE